MRAELEHGRDGSPLLSELELFYLPRNRAPRIDSLGYEPAGIVWAKGPVQSSARTGPVAADDPVARRAASKLVRARRPPIRRSYELGARTFTWDAEDADGDRLTYRLEIQRQGSADWVALAKDIHDAFYSWDARSMPDGLYRVRLIADDSRDNPGGLGLSDRRLGELFRIDNTRPAVRGFDVERTADTLEVEFEATDPGGTIAAVEFALDGGAWQAIDPVDGIADSDVERYRLEVAAAGDPASARSLRVRVTDTVGNLGGDLWLLDERP